MTEYHVDTQSQAWKIVVESLLGAPVVAPRGLKVREMTNPTTVIIERPQTGFVDVEGRSLNHAITAVEGASLIGQCSVPEWITDQTRNFAPFANDGIFWGAYGPRAHGDLGQIVSLLKRDPDSRQAVVTLYDSDRDLGRPDIRDVPCTLNIQFRLRDQRWGPEDSDVSKVLHMWVTMRSNDAWLGLPYDLGQFSLLQYAMAEALGAGIGTYTHSAGSMHLYEKNWDDAAHLGAVRPILRSGSLGYMSPVPVFNGNGTLESTSRRMRMLLQDRISELEPLSPLEAWMVQELA